MSKWPFMEMEGRYQKQMGAKRLSFLFPCWGKITAKKTETDCQKDFFLSDYDHGISQSMVRINQFVEF